MSKFVLAVLSLVSFTSAAVVPGSTANAPYVAPPPAAKQAGLPGFVHLALTKKPAKALRKRQSPDPLQNDISGYSVEITLGTPPQIQWVDLDTGSNELWVNPLCSTSYYPAGCTANGVYNPGSSSTSHDLGTPFSISYGIGSVSGTYYTDNMTMGDASIRQQQFGDAATSQQMMQGILGIAWGNGVDTNYNNVIDNLKAQGITQSRAFGLNLASIDSPTGAIIFGGIDIMKYSGPLQKQPIIPRNLAPDGYARYWFYMNQVSITPPGATAPIALTSPTYNQAMFPDSGSTFCQLPSALFTALLAYFPVGQVNQGSSTYTVSCNYRTQAGYINFAFGSVTVSVSYHEFIWFDGVQCWFAAQPSTQFYLLGDSFMRSAYIVYDQDNSNVFIAPAANCGTSIIPISTGVNAVPSINGLCAPTYTPPIVTTSTPSPTPTSTPHPSTSSSSTIKSSSSFVTSSSKLTTSSPVPTSTGFTTSSSSTSSKPSSSSTLSSSSSKISSLSSSSLIPSPSSSTQKIISSSSTPISSSSNKGLSSISSPVSTKSSSIMISSTSSSIKLSSSSQVSNSGSQVSSTSSLSSSKASSCLASTVQITLTQSATSVTVYSVFTVVQIQSASTLTVSIPYTVIQTQSASTVYVTLTSTAAAPSVAPITITITAAAPSVAPIIITSLTTVTVAASSALPSIF
ncbi:acid protease [Mollisia scopiformis]|uniref:Acid protease n=1 Tax=Mollisia scopiformis TaxID=149040 RepID=A0A132B989_MOLSC|nr:acid protease [Mollisia scopiformis]KUJ08970.1 acid protease [Mollisia scopiformis]